MLVASLVSLTLTLAPIGVPGAMFQPSAPSEESPAESAPAQPDPVEPTVGEPDPVEPPTADAPEADPPAAAEGARPTDDGNGSEPDPGAADPSGESIPPPSDAPPPEADPPEEVTPPPPPAPETPANEDSAADEAYEDEAYEDEEYEDDYDPRVDSPEAVLARRRVIGGGLLLGTGLALSLGGLALGLSDPCARAAGNSCSRSARRRAALTMGLPGLAVVAAGIAFVAIGRRTQQRLASEHARVRPSVSFDLRSAQLGLRGRF